MNIETTPERSSVKRNALLCAIGLGVLGDLLLRKGLVGPGTVLWMVVVGFGATWLVQRVDITRRLPVAIWSAVAILAVLLMVLRDNGSVQSLLFLLLPLSLAQVIMLSWGARFGRSLPVDQLYALMLVPIKSLIGFVPLFSGVSRTLKFSRAAGIFRGLVLALPLLWIFSALLSSADAGFARLTQQVFDLFTLPYLSERVIVILLLTWVSGGWLGAVVADNSANRLAALPMPNIGRDETLIVLGSLVLLFGSFVLLQLSYLFGGQEVIKSVSGLTMADYARRGFFELVFIAGLTLGVLLFVGAVTAHHFLYRLLAFALVGLVLVMLVSATQRFVLYIDTFGLSLDRLTALAILLWLAFTLVYFAATGLREKLTSFATGSVVAAVTMVIVFALMNPTAMVARVNLDRAIEQQQTLDTYYLLRLGADAVPTILKRMDSLSEADQCDLAAQLLVRWNAEAHSQTDWRVWSAAKMRAVAQVNQVKGDLQLLSADCPIDR